MLSFGTCNGNRGGFTVNNLGILVPKRTRLELPFICFGGHFRKKNVLYLYVFSRLLLCNAPKKCIKRCCPHPRPRTASKQQEERIRGLDTQAECELQFKWKEVKRILKENIFSQGSVFLQFLSSFIIIRIAVSFFVKKYRMIWLAQLPTVYCSLLIFWMFRYALEDFQKSLSHMHVFLNKVFILAINKKAFRLEGYVVCFVSFNTISCWLTCRVSI